MKPNHYLGELLEKDWRDHLEIGDVVLNKNGTKRIVRNVTKSNGYLRYVSFLIIRCSWKVRCYTTLCRTDLRSYSPTKFECLDFKLK